MRAIFISYRREDAEGEAGRLFDDLVAQFGADSVFMDVAGIAAGRDFRKVIDEKVGTCAVLLAVMGKRWVDATNTAGKRRLDDPADFVRLETASALRRDIPVIPVLVHGAVMPAAEALPEDLRELVYRNGVELTHARWKSDVKVLVEALRPHVGAPKNAAADDDQAAAGVHATHARHVPPPHAPRAEPNAAGTAPAQAESPRPLVQPHQGGGSKKRIIKWSLVAICALGGIGNLGAFGNNDPTGAFGGFIMAAFFLWDPFKWFVVKAPA